MPTTRASQISDCQNSILYNVITYPNCKINIGLHIVRKREDGYHDLETIFLPVDAMHDELEIEILEDGHTLLKIEGEMLDCSAEDNLCMKAFRMLEKDYNKQMKPVSIRLRKGIPFGAGLGGGSSDAAFTLKMLNQIFNLQLSNKVLRDYAAKLGADCAFFIENRPCYATGIGDILEPINLDLKKMGIRMEIVKPNDNVNTREAYAGVHPHPHDVDLRQAIALPVEQWKELIVNDFEASIFPQHPNIAAQKEKFYQQGAIYASMTGSGAAVFGIWRNEK